MNAVAQTLKKTALLYAIEKGHVVVAKMLIHYGADVNGVEKDKWTALHFA